MATAVMILGDTAVEDSKYYMGTMYCTLQQDPSPELGPSHQDGQ